MMNNEIVKFTNDIRSFLQTASQNGMAKIPDQKLLNVIGMLEETKQQALKQGQDVKPIDDLIGEVTALKTGD